MQSIGTKTAMRSHSLSDFALQPFLWFMSLLDYV
jgi:hypothetical protein